MIEINKEMFAEKFDHICIFHQNIQGSILKTSAHDDVPLGCVQIRFCEFNRKTWSGGWPGRPLVLKNQNRFLLLEDNHLTESHFNTNTPMSCSGCKYISYSENQPRYTCHALRCVQPRALIVSASPKWEMDSIHIDKHSHSAFIYSGFSIIGQFRVQCFAQGHLDTQTGGSNHHIVDVRCIT